MFSSLYSQFSAACFPASNNSLTKRWRMSMCFKRVLQVAGRFCYYDWLSVPVQLSVLLRHMISLGLKNITRARLSIIHVKCVIFLKSPNFESCWCALIRPPVHISCQWGLFEQDVKSYLLLLNMALSIKLIICGRYILV